TFPSRHLQGRAVSFSFLRWQVRRSSAIRLLAIRETPNEPLHSTSRGDSFSSPRSLSGAKDSTIHPCERTACKDRLPLLRTNAELHDNARQDGVKDGR